MAELPTRTAHSLPTDQLLRQLASSQKGLSATVASERRRIYGPNRLPRKRRLSIVKLAVQQFANPFAYILFVALGLSLLTRDVVDALIIGLVIVVSASFSFAQEFRANRVLERLSTYLRRTARVIRDGHQRILPSEDVVPGDVIHVLAGDHIPADARLLTGTNLTAIEAPLTGESAPSRKRLDVLPAKTALADRENMLYLGTVLASGSATAVVTATGPATELGRIARLTAATQTQRTPLQKQLQRFARLLGLVVVGVVAVLFVVGLATGRPIIEMLLTSVALVVAAVPEGLLPALTVILAVGMQRLSRRKGLVRRMLAAETLGSVTVIAADKTGTLTRGEMRVAQFIAPDGTSDDHAQQAQQLMLKAGVFANQAVVEQSNTDAEKAKIVGDPTDVALLRAALARGLDLDQLEERYPQLGEVPFDTAYQFAASLNRETGSHEQTQDAPRQAVVYVKGAPEVLAQRAKTIWVNGSAKKFDAAAKKTFTEQYQQATGQGYRVLALARRTWSRPPNEFERSQVEQLELLGLVALADPLRADTKQVIKRARQAGIRTLIVTGDHRLTAIAVVKKLGLRHGPKNVMEGQELDGVSDYELEERVHEIDVFARVSPHQKIRIVRALQANGEVAAMTGDGVNDAPALRQADVGVALGSGTDVAKEVADLVLLDDRFYTILEAIRGGRIIYNNLRKVVVYLLTDAFTEVILVGGAVLLGLPLPLLPAQILWINLMEDALPASALGFDHIDEDVLKQKPRPPGESIIPGRYRLMIVLYLLIMDGTAFGIFIYFWNTTQDSDYVRSVLFAALGLASLLYAYPARALRRQLWQINPFGNWYLNGTIAAGIALLFAALYAPPLQALLQTQPISGSAWVVVGMFGLMAIVVYESLKRFIIRRA